MALVYDFEGALPFDCGDLGRVALSESAAKNGSHGLAASGNNYGVAFSSSEFHRADAGFVAGVWIRTSSSQIGGGILVGGAGGQTGFQVLVSTTGIQIRKGFDSASATSVSASIGSSWRWLEVSWIAGEVSARVYDAPLGTIISSVSRSADFDIGYVGLAWYNDTEFDDFTISDETRDPQVDPTYQQDIADGLLVLEAENAFLRGDWIEDPIAGASGTAVYAGSGGSPSSFAGSRAHLLWRVAFEETGPHYIWIRGQADGADNTCFIVANGKYVGGFSLSGSSLAWFNNRFEGADSFSVDAAGTGTLAIFAREPGLRIDRFIVTTNPAYDPSAVNGGMGPAESGTVGSAASPPVAGFSLSVEGLTVTLTDTSTDADSDLATIDVEWGDGSPDATGQPPGSVLQHTYAAGGSYTITLTATDAVDLTDQFSDTVEVSEPVPIAGDASGTGTTNAQLLRSIIIQAQAQGSSDATAALRALRQIQAAASGAGGTQAAATARRLLSASASGAGELSAEALAERLIAGVASGRGGAQAELHQTVVTGLQGTLSGTSDASAALRITRRLTGVASMVSSAEAYPEHDVRLGGTASGVGAAEAYIGAAITLSGLLAGRGGADGNLERALQLVALATGYSSASAEPAASHVISAIARGHGASSAAPMLSRLLSAAADGVLRAEAGLIADLPTRLKGPLVSHLLDARRSSSLTDPKRVSTL